MNQKYKFPIIVVLVFGLIFGWNTFKPKQITPTPEPLLEISEPTEIVALEPTESITQTVSLILPTPTRSVIAVYVSGAVNQPGVYRLYEGARIDDAIYLAGGMTADADPIRINLAARVHDEQQVYVARRDEVLPNFLDQTNPTDPPASNESEQTPESPPASNKTGKININTATLAELDSLPRIGPATAQRIIDYRTSNGKFATIEDLQNVKGIGAGTFADLKALISVSDD